MRYLVLHDVDTIQDYIFATDRLQEIQGASALIDHLNRNVTAGKVKESAGNSIYANGGGMAAYFDNPNDANRLCRQIAELYSDKTITATSTGVVQLYDENADDSASNNFQQALQVAQKKLRQKKESRSRQTQLLTNPFFKRCQSCGVCPAVHYYGPQQPPEGFVCLSCRTKRMERRNRHPRIHQMLRCRVSQQHQYQELQFPALLDEIGNRSDPPGYVGVLYADGNRMGDLLQEIRTSKALGQFSDMVDQALTKALTQTLLYRYNDSFLSSAPEQGYPIPAVVPLCGGDDLVAIVPGNDALEVALDYLERFQQQTKQALSEEEALSQMIGKDQLSACAGIAIAKAHIPLSRLLDLAHHLCLQAKRRSYQELQTSAEKKEVSCVDFQVINTPNWEELDEARKGPQYQLDQNTRLTARPYTLQETRSLIKAISDLKKAKFPASKLHQLYRSLWMGPSQAQLEYLTLYVRARDINEYSQKEALKSAEGYLCVPPHEAPWQHWPEIPGNRGKQTPYRDLVEIYSFVSS